MDTLLFLAQTPAAPAAQPGLPGGMLIPMVLIFGIFYLMMIRPQQRKEKERRKMISEIRAGQKVLLNSGFLGEVVESREKTFVVEIAPGVRTEVIRDAVSSVVAADGAEAK